MKEKLKALIGKAENGKLAPFVQFVKFGLVGVSNTAISYGIEMLGYYVLFAKAQIPEQVKIVVVTVLAFSVSVINSYFWNNRFVFKSETKRTFGEHARAFLKMVASYAATGLVLAPLLKMWFSQMGIPYWLASLLTIFVTVPLNFLLNKKWAFGKKKKKADATAPDGQFNSDDNGGNL